MAYAWEFAVEDQEAIDAGDWVARHTPGREEAKSLHRTDRQEVSVPCLDLWHRRDMRGSKDGPRG